MGFHAGVGLRSAPVKCMESCIWPMLPAGGAERRVWDHFYGSREPPSGTFGVRNWIPRRPQHGFRSFPRHVSTTAFPWGRRQWAQPSRIRRPHMGCRRVDVKKGSSRKLLYISPLRPRGRGGVRGYFSPAPAMLFLLRRCPFGRGIARAPL